MKKLLWPFLFCLALSLPGWADDSAPNVAALAAAPGPPNEVRQHVQETMRGWFATSVHVADPREAPLWQGVADWMAEDAVAQTHPDIRLLDASDQAFSLWNDEDGVAGSPQVLVGGKGSSRKAVALLRMLDGWLGHDAVRQGLQSFVVSYDGRPVTGEDLWTAIQSKADPAGARLHVAQVMTSWVNNLGCPLVRTKLVSTSHGPAVEVSQEGFTLYPKTPPNNSGQEWAIPLRIRYQDASGLEEVKTVLEGKSKEIPLPADGKVQWAYPNGGGMGFYRTELPEGELRAVIGNLSSLSEPEKVALMSNQWRMVRHGSAQVADFLELVSATAADAEPSVAQIDLVELGFERSQVRPEDRSALASLTSETFAPFVEKHGLQIRDGEPWAVTTTRWGVVQSLAEAGDSAAQQELQSWTARWLKGDPAVWDWMVAVSDDGQVFDKLAERLKTKPSQRMDTLQLLAQVRGAANASRYVSLVLGSDLEMLDADRAKALLYPIQADNAQGMDEVWEALKNRYESIPAVDTVVRKYAVSPYRNELGRLVSSKGADSTKSALAQAEGLGPGDTLATLPEQLHDYLHHRVSSAPPPHHHRH